MRAHLLQRRRDHRGGRHATPVILVATALMAGFVIGFAAPASATPSWTLAPSPSPAGPPAGTLSGVSCADSTHCFAVGSSQGNALIEQWDGSVWTIASSPTPTGGTDVSLLAVTCTDASDCFAVGHFRASTGEQDTLGENWNGTGWSIVSTENPPVYTSTLSAVSCLSSTDCLAVGAFLGPSFTGLALAEQWNGTAWSIVGSQNPAGGTDSELTGVACADAADCFAVGRYFASGVKTELLESWNGTGFTTVAAPSPSGAATTNLAGVACPDATHCFAVGSYTSAGAGKPLTERWTGSTWSVLFAPNPTGASGTVLSGVSCAVATLCTAVGSYKASGVRRTLVERWNGTLLAIATSPNPSGAAASTLVGASCTIVPVQCVAVGASTLIESWDGATWSIAVAPLGYSQSQLGSVSCPTITRCFAVGTYVDTSFAHRTLIEEWDGSAWSTVPSANPSGVAPSLTSVSCASAANCFAVGQFTSGSVPKTLIEKLNGSRWTIVASPTPKGGEPVSLSGVSCKTGAGCFAVGTYFSGTYNFTLAERWNGTGWSIVPSASPNGAYASELYGVSCSATTNCLAVGGTFLSSGDFKTLTERWDGTTWKQISSPPAASTSPDLSGVSCTASTSCFAVGKYTVGSVDKTLVEHFSGTTWSVATSPNPAGPSTLSGISCKTSTSCFAVGSFSAANGTDTLVEMYS